MAALGKYGVADVEQLKDLLVQRRMPPVPTVLPCWRWYVNMSCAMHPATPSSTSVPAPEPLPRHSRKAIPK